MIATLPSLIQRNGKGKSTHLIFTTPRKDNCQGIVFLAQVWFDFRRVFIQNVNSFASSCEEFLESIRNIEYIREIPRGEQERKLNLNAGFSKKTTIGRSSRYSCRENVLSKRK